MLNVHILKNWHHSCRVLSARAALLLAALLMLASQAIAQVPATETPLRIKARTPVAQFLDLSLESGTIIRVTPADINGDALIATTREIIPIISGMAIGLRSGITVVVLLKDVVGASPFIPQTTPAISGDHMPVIRAHCQRLFPENFSLRNFCEEDQLKSYKALQQRR